MINDIPRPEPTSFIKMLIPSHRQYIMPVWQRLYSWGKKEVEQLICDIEVVGRSEDPAAHFGGLFISYPSTTTGPFHQHLVVDGQQRFATVSLLLHVIKERLDESNLLNDWGEPKIEQLLFNEEYSKSDEKRHKLVLHPEDQKAICQLFSSGKLQPGKIASAYQVLKKTTPEIPIPVLKRGIERFIILHFECKLHTDSPQQIFESINATGITLKPAEQVKNYLFMGLTVKEQEKWHRKLWQEMLKNVGLTPSDEAKASAFLADFLRWQRGRKISDKDIYREFKAWWTDGLDLGDDKSVRAEACGEALEAASKLYGAIIGIKPHKSRKVRSILDILRDMPTNVHRPFVLRVLSDITHEKTTEDEAVKTLDAVTSWVVRLWIAARSNSSPVAELFSVMAGAPFRGQDYAEFWINQMRQKQYHSPGVPQFPAILNGVSSTARPRPGKAEKRFLWEISKNMSRDSHPAISDLSIEHIMPQNAEKWNNYLAGESPEHYEEHVNTLANLTLVGASFNARLGNNTFALKRKEYRHSTVAITKQLAEEYSNWLEDDLKRRAEQLAKLAEARWPWAYGNERMSQDAEGLGMQAAWRMNGGIWNQEKNYRAVLLNVIAALLDKNKEKNSKSLMGSRVSVDLYPADFLPSTGSVKEIPGHEEYVICINHSVAQTRCYCEEYGKRCGETIEVK